MIARALLKELRASALILGATLAVSNCIAGGVRIPSESMQPTLDPGDFVAVNRLAYGFTMPVAVKQLAHWADPARGDVVIFNAPAQANPDEVLFIKRVVALEGDVIEVRDHRVFVNGQAETLNMAPPGVPAGPRANMPAYKVPAGHVFVMGDNRGNSDDSRAWGPLPVERVRGKALGVMFSLDWSRWKAGQLL